MSNELRFKVPAADPSEIVVVTARSVAMIREGRLLAAFAGFLLGDAVELVLPPCPHVYFTTRAAASGWTRHTYSITCLACGAIVENVD